MGLKEKLKIKVKGYWEEKKQLRKEDKAFKQILSKKVREARREAHAKATIQQIKLQTARRMKARYSPPTIKTTQIKKTKRKPKSNIVYVKMQTAKKLKAKSKPIKKKGDYMTNLLAGIPE